MHFVSNVVKIVRVWSVNVSVRLSICRWKTGFHLHAVCIEEADVGEVVRVVPVCQAQQQLPLHASQPVDLLVKVGL